MKCPYEECVLSEDCVILDITKKIPKSMKTCSYSKEKKTDTKKRKDKK